MISLDSPLAKGLGQGTKFRAHPGLELVAAESTTTLHGRSPQATPSLSALGQRLSVAISPLLIFPDGLSGAPTLLVRGAPRRRTARRARDLDAEDFTGVSDDEVANPCRQRRAPPAHRVLGVPRPLERTPLGADKRTKTPAAGIRARWPAAGCHRVSDITISGIRTRGLGAAPRAGERRPLVVAGDKYASAALYRTRFPGHQRIGRRDRKQSISGVGRLV